MRRSVKYVVILTTASLLIAPKVVLSAELIVDKPKLYNETFNPGQKEYPDHLGFNSLHIEAICKAYMS